MVDGNGKQTITNDGATVMKVFRPYILPAVLDFETDSTFSFSTLSILPLESSQTSLVHKTPKLETELPLSLCWPEKS
jgi:hypothetical protein